MRTLIPLLALAAAGCGGEEPFWTDTWDPNRQQGPKGDLPDPPDHEPPAAQDCNWSPGSYALTDALCGGSSHGAWQSRYTGATMVVTHNHYRGCDVKVTLENESCAQELTFWGDPPEEPEDPTAAIVEFKDNPNDEMPYGVTHCNPFECKFKTDEEPCATGQFAGDMTSSVDQSQDGRLALRYFMTYAAPECNEMFTLVFEKQ